MHIIVYFYLKIFIGHIKLFFFCYSFLTPTFRFPLEVTIRALIFNELKAIKQTISFCTKNKNHEKQTTLMSYEVGCSRVQQHNVQYSVAD